MTSHEPLVSIIQEYVAVKSINPSLGRNSGAPGVVAKLRQALKRLDLSKFGTSDEVRFDRVLIAETNRVRKCIPAAARTWGLARKAVNLFLRDAFYNRYLCRKYGLAKAEALFEIPLDSVVAKALCCGLSDYTGLKWNGVGRLNWASSKRFQSLAAERSKKEGVTRVNLDALLWVKYRK